LLAVCAVLGGLVMLPAASAGAAPLVDCTQHRGTVVAVDFAHWGGPIVRGCGIDQATGYDLIQAAGFTTAGDAEDGTSFICRIGDKAFHDGTQYPTPSQDACIQTPPASAYWSYWLAPAGKNTWTYSELGPLGDVPKPGEVELWMFGGTTIGGAGGSAVPHFSPSTLRAAVTTATPTTTATTTTPAATTTTTTTTTHPATTRATTTTAAHTSAAKTRPPVHRPVRHPGRPRRTARARPPAARAVASAGTSTTGPPVIAAQPTRADGSSGSPLPLVLGICLALALAGGGVWTARRRRYE
jgi:hypothetical protein